MTEAVTLEAFARHLLALAPVRRAIAAIAGAPGSGKSTVAAKLVMRMNEIEPGAAALLPMDGYHYDDILLKELGRHARKGAPDTFDVGGLKAMLARLRANAEEAVAVPVFDRDIEIARAGGRLISRTARIIVAEGNYLLLDEAPWNGLAPEFDATMMIDVPLETLRARLTRRWKGYNLAPEEIARKVEENDLPNGRFVIEKSRAADFALAN
jgi:pantothenate kinase